MVRPKPQSIQPLHGVDETQIQQRSQPREDEFDLRVQRVDLGFELTVEGVGFSVEGAELGIELLVEGAIVRSNVLDCRIEVGLRDDVVGEFAAERTGASPSACLAS